MIKNTFQGYNWYSNLLNTTGFHAEIGNWILENNSYKNNPKRRYSEKASQSGLRSIRRNND